jgi:hypothetical protein
VRSGLIAFGALEAPEAPLRIARAGGDDAVEPLLEEVTFAGAQHRQVGESGA